MKSPQVDRRLQTSCKNCVFAIYNDGITQTGCVANRIEKFDKNDIIEAYDSEKEFYVINKFCNLYRSQRWNCGKPDLDKALQESSLDFDILVNCNNINENLKSYLLSSIGNIDYNPDKFAVNLFHEYGASSDVKSMVLEIYAAFRSIKISVCVNSDLFLHELILKSKRNCHVIINEFFDFNSLKSLNNLVNKDLKKFIAADCGSNIFAISNMAYKMNYANDPLDSYDSNIKNIIEISKNTGMYINI